MSCMVLTYKNEINKMQNTFLKAVEGLENHYVIDLNGKTPQDFEALLLPELPEEKKNEIANKLVWQC
jgi:hypothetical protein